MRHPLDGIRERTGRGASLRVSMLDALGEWMSQPAHFAHYGGHPPRRTGARHPSISPYGPFKVRDCFATSNARVEHNDELTAPPIAAKPTDVQG